MIGRRLARVHDEQAQGVIEFALVISIMLMMFLGTVDYGRWLYYDDAVRSAARVGTEYAINHCPSRPLCGLSPQPVKDNYVVQATACEDSPYVTLQPQPATCLPCSFTDPTQCTDPCAATCLGNVCQQDICIKPLAPRSNGADVTVYVGYAFKPISFVLAPFFQTQSCYPNDPTSNNHTICAQSTGRVS